MENFKFFEFSLLFRYFETESFHRFSLWIPNNIHTQDQYPIIATPFEPENANGKLLLVNSATWCSTNVHFAQHFGKFGFCGWLTYDYRGVVLNQTSPKVLKRAWELGEIQTIAVTDFIEEHYPHHRKFLIGHSVGALILEWIKVQKFLKILFQKYHQNTYFDIFSN